MTVWLGIAIEAVLLLLAWQQIDKDRFGAATVLLVAAFLVALYTSPPARAAGFSYPGERPARSRMVAELVDVADGYASERGISLAPCPRGQLTVLVAPDLDGANGRTLGCTMWLRAGLLHDALTEHFTTPSWRGFSRDMLCFAVVHERLHTLGLSHDPANGTVMSAPWTSDLRNEPWGCRVWRRSDDTAKAALARRGRTIR